MTALLTDNKRFLKRLLAIAVPIILQDLANSCVNLLDFLMVGQLGLNAINGVGLSNQVFFLFVLVCFGITSGSSILLGQSWGKRDIKSIYRTMGLCAMFTLTAALIFAVAAIAIPHTILSFYSREQDVIETGARYLRVVACSYVLSAVTLVFNAACRATGNTKVPMMTTMVALVCNAVFNALFIFGLGWGVTGAAIATVISRVVELAAMAIIIRRLRLPIGTRIRNYFRENAVMLKPFLKYALPVVGNESLWALGTTLYSVAYKYCGNEAQGAVQISGQLFNIFWVVGMGFSSGCGVILANLLGAGERETAIAYSRKAIAVGMIVAFLMGGLLFALAPILPYVYDVPDTVRRTASTLMRISAVCILLKTFNYTTIVAILRSGGDTLFCLFVDLAGVWLFGVPLAFLSAAVLGWPVYLVMLMVYSEELVKAIITLPRVLSNRWANKVV